MTQFNNGCAPQADTKTPEKVYTREDVMLQREAYARALVWHAGYTSVGAANKAAEKYPLPKKIVPRVLVGVADRPEYNYRIIDGKVQVCTNNSILNAGWTSTIFSAEDFKKFGELAASPTCEVDA